MPQKVTAYDALALVSHEARCRCNRTINAYHASGEQVTWNLATLVALQDVFCAEGVTNLDAATVPYLLA